MIRTLTPISSILIAILLFVFFIQPEYEKTSRIQEEIRAYQEASRNYESFLNLIEHKFNTKNTQAAFNSERLDTLVPATIDDARILVDLERIAKSKGMLFGNVGVEKEAGDPFSGDTESEKENREELYATDISFEVIGTYEQFKSMLSEIETSLTLFEVTQIAFNVTEGLFQQFAITVRVYSLERS